METKTTSKKIKLEETKRKKTPVKRTCSCIKELIKFGYIQRNRLKDEKGRFTGYEYHVYEISSITPKTENGLSENGKRLATNNELTNNDLTNYKKDNGISSNDEDTHSFLNKDIVKAIKVYMSELYIQKTGKKHPFLKAEQYKKAYSAIESHMDEWGTEYDNIIDMMCQFLNTKTIVSDWNINHFATEGIMLNRMYEVAY